MDRITEKQLDALCARLNRLTGSPLTYMDAERRILIGHYHVSHAYGGVCLHRTMNASGGVTTPLAYGHVTKRELWNQMHAYLSGIEAGMQREMQS